MKNIIKCTNCGSTDFERKVYYTEHQLDAGNFSLQGLNTYACKNCGHIEFFDASLDTYDKEVKENIRLEEEKRKDELKKEILMVEDEIKKTNDIINDLDSTQRQVKEAKEKLPALRQKLESLKYKVR